MSTSSRSQSPTAQTSCSQASSQPPSSNKLNHKYWLNRLKARINKKHQKRAWRKILETANPEHIFTKIYQKNGWHGMQSLSGRGSDVDQTAALVAYLPQLLTQLEVKRLLDVPCGDFNWMRHALPDFLDYTGGDIVSELVSENQRQFANERIRFQSLDLLQSTLGAYDLIFCRDCLVHLSNQDVLNALTRMVNSGSRYLALTTFNQRIPERGSSQQDISTGDWRPINLEAAPFNLPKPLILFNEGCTQDSGKFADKCIGVWKVKDLLLKLR